MCFTKTITPPPAPQLQASKLPSEAIIGASQAFGPTTAQAGTTGSTKTPRSTTGAIGAAKLGGFSPDMLSASLTPVIFNKLGG